ncbi:hypothetical protein D1007_37632 [Hordeum vulgare]|nr:hypothetical protein D1007_37632 [Hordeum vulgare]
MGKAGRWLRSILAGKKGGGRRGDKWGQSRCDSTPLAELPVAASLREKRRWSFRRPAPPVKTVVAPSPLALEPGGLSVAVAVAVAEHELEQSKHAVAVAMAVADAAVIRLTPPEAEDDLNLYATPFQEAATARIQATFRGYLKGVIQYFDYLGLTLIMQNITPIVENSNPIIVLSIGKEGSVRAQGSGEAEALIRGHLVRKQARATLQRMQALLMAQTRVRAQRMHMLEDEDHTAALVDHRSPQDPRRRRSYVRRGACQDRGDGHGEPPRGAGSSCSVTASEPWPREGRRADYYVPGQCSPAPSAGFSEITSPRAYNGRFEDFEPATARISAYVRRVPRAREG